MTTVIRHQRDQHYATIFNQDTGFFARIEKPGYEEPFWAQHGPELLDIAITNWCDRYCSFCYRSSNTNGSHMSYDTYRRILKDAKKIGVMQVALGGGNPNQHPDFCKIIKLTREAFDVVPNYTTNGRGLSHEVLESSRQYCGAVAISAYYPYHDLQNAIGLLTERGIKTNVHFVLTSKSISTAISWLESPPSFFETVNALIFLNYKPIGRSNDESLLLKNSEFTERLFKLATSNKFAFKIGFDSCSSSGITLYSDVSPACYEGCDAGRFSMFISEAGVMYPCSFMLEAGYRGEKFIGNNMLEYWKSGKEMVDIRESLRESQNAVLSGCPIFPEINLS